MRVPDSLYHITDESRKNAIVNVGLRSGMSRISVNHGPIEGIYLCDDWREMLSQQPDWLGRRLAIFEIDVRGIKNKLRLDDEFDMQSIDEPLAFYSVESIGPERIRFIGIVDLTSPGRSGTSTIIPDFEEI